MNLERFFEEKWKVSGMNGDGFELRGEDSETYVWLKIDDVIGLLAKLHLQYEDEDLKIILDDAMEGEET